MGTFRAFPKVPRLSREVIITEKIDGSNASVMIEPWLGQEATWAVNGWAMYAGSRTRWITPEDDNYGFAAWVRDNAEELVTLGAGHHFGEWWGRDIQRTYGLKERRFSLFNVGRWAANNTCVLEGQERAPECCYVVPVLWRGELDTLMAYNVLTNLSIEGSRAAPGFMDPEGIMLYHTAANRVFKKTTKGDAEGKSAEAHPKKERMPRPPRDPNKGGRRIGLTPGYAGPERRLA